MGVLGVLVGVSDLEVRSWEDGDAGSRSSPVGRLPKRWASSVAIVSVNAGVLRSSTDAFVSSVACGEVPEVFVVNWFHVSAGAQWSIPSQGGGSMGHRHHHRRGGVVFSRGQRKCRRRLCIALNRVEGLSSDDKKKEHQRINKTILFHAKYDLPPPKPRQKKCLAAPPPKPVPAAHHAGCSCRQCNPSPEEWDRLRRGVWW